MQAVDYRTGRAGYPKSLNRLNWKPKRISSWYHFQGPMSFRLVPDLSIYLVVSIIQTVLKHIHTYFTRSHSTV
ncbi:hypothetical protein ARMSODRAFT_72468 [Armillaria solidipes]|uniref:Uncharacterized protein n=1 Tax=Armillaria solidipes TaxID=1076256 RepID=A0A2H3BZ54_9AGAR|nr:hypothetical protein ARMSODRAFT_72468 [Armillaria solidipes]